MNGIEVTVKTAERVRKFESLATAQSYLNELIRSGTRYRLSMRRLGNNRQGLQQQRKTQERERAIQISAARKTKEIRQRKTGV